MNGAGDQFLARAAFSQNQNIRRCIGHFADRRKDPGHFAADSDHPAKKCFRRFLSGNLMLTDQAVF